MFTFDAIQLAGIIAASFIIGGIVGFFAMAILAMGGRCSEQEERHPWPGEVK